MKNLIKRTLVAEKRFFTCLVATMFAAALSAGTVNYTADNNTIFPNPERGFITMLERHANERYAVKGNESRLKELKTNDKGTLVLVLYYLDEFKAVGTLPDSILLGFDEDMEVLRNYGMKAILRFAYTNEDYTYLPEGKKDSVRSAHDAPLEIIKQHLAQYKSHWEANADVIFCFQAGFVGQYGEWYYTDYFGNKADTINSERKAFLDTLLNATPQNRYILLRTPLFKTGYLDSISVSKAALTPEEAFKGTAKARLGQHNDAFLNGPLNQGTYSDTATQKPWLAQETKYVPIGGECNITKQDTATKYANHDATVSEMSRLHWTFIQSGYAETTTNMWRGNGTFDELNRNMGYRFQLVSATLPETANAGDEVSIALNIKNVGYAPLYNERHAYIVLKNKNASYSIQLATDPRTWLPNGVTTAINEQITIPAGVADGTYNLYLHMPDAYASLAGDSRYSVRFANEGVWQRITGMNRLMATITIGDVEPEDIDPEIAALTDSLKKANVTDFSDDMLWYENDYFDFATGGKNTSAWAEWTVNIETPGKYLITEVGYYPNGHNYLIQLLDGNTVKAEFTTAETWSSGYKTITQGSKWDLCNISAGVYTLRIKNAMENGKPKLKALKIDLFGAVSSDTINLPATLNKANAANYSNNILWYNTDYFDFATGGKNTDGWVEWNINLKYPWQYIVSEVGYYTNGHNYSLNLVNLNGDTISSYTTAKTYSTGDITIVQSIKWDLSIIPAGKYKLRVSNALENGAPKLQSLTLTYDGELPTGIDDTEADNADTQQYDILGRPVDESYHGIVIMRGKKILR